MHGSPRFGRLAAATLALGLSASAFAGFASTEAFLPAVGRLPGKNGAEFYTTVWATNLTGVPVHFTFDFLKAGQANPNPAHFTDTLAPGETKVYENVVETKLGLTNALGAARIVSDGEILVAERIYDQAPGAALGDTEGLFFAGVPKNFSISAGQSASIQGIDQGGSEDFRYNFALVETGGGSPTVNVQVFDGAGTLLGQKAFPLSPYEQLQPGVGDVVAGFSSINARLTATVTEGTGSVLLAGAQVANVSQDSSGFEMSFRDDILGSGGTAGVTSLNGLTGALTIAHGANTTVNVSGHTITIDAVAGSGTGLTAVAHDGSLAGSGTASLPLAIANGQVVRSLNGLHDAVTLAQGSNITLTPSGSTITIAATGGGGGGLTLPYAGTTTNSDHPAFSVTNTANGGVYGSSGGSSGVWGEGGTFGVYGDGAQGGVYGTGPTGVYGQSNTTTATSRGVYGTGEVGVYGEGAYRGVYGEGPAGIVGWGTASYGVFSYGNFGGTGAKYFVEPHPTDPEKEIRFVSLEGPESGTYFRGTSHIVGGFATIEIPESFRMVTAEKGLTVVVTPVGDPAMLYCVRRSLDQILIKGSADVEFDYVVNGVRKAFEDHEAISENEDFVPRSATDPHFTMGLPAESIRRLKASGILNPDGTINLETAHRLGWDQTESWKRAEAAKER